MGAAEVPENSPAIWFLRTSRLFDESGETTLGMASSQGRRLEFGRGDCLGQVGSGFGGIHLILEGRVKFRTFSEGGKEKILDIAGPGDVFGPLESVLADRPSAAGRALLSPDGLATEAVAMSAVVVHRFTLPEFRHLVERRPSVMLSVSRLLGLKQQQILIRLNRLLFRTSLGKVAGLLAELSERYGSETPTGRVLSFRLTHQEMASMIGVKRETVSECLAILECEGIIATRQRQITICRPTALDAIE